MAGRESAIHHSRLEGVQMKGLEAGNISDGGREAWGPVWLWTGGAIGTQEKRMSRVLTH